MKRRVVYVGGPLCGRAEKLHDDDIVEYLTYDVEGRRFTYQHVLRAVTNGTLRVQHRYLFMGYKPKLPAWLKRAMKKEGGHASE
jgi:uncharacterized protein YfaS (alpha-2-macroglobulin family)